MNIEHAEHIIFPTLESELELELCDLGVNQREKGWPNESQNYLLLLMGIKLPCRMQHMNMSIEYTVKNEIQIMRAISILHFLKEKKKSVSLFNLWCFCRL